MLPLIREKTTGVNVGVEYFFSVLVYYKNFDFVSVFFLISLFCYRIFSSADVTDHFFPSKYYLQLYTCTKECSEQFVKQNIHAIFLSLARTWPSSIEFYNITYHLTLDNSFNILNMTETFKTYINYTPASKHIYFKLWWLINAQWIT